MYVMDVATGAGIWAIQFAEQNPTSHVIRTDLSKIQPEVPLSNIEFLKEDAEEEWLYPNVSKFDYIHLRFVLSCFNSPKKVMQQALENLKPGGWIEYHNFYGQAMSPNGSHEGTVMQRYWSLFGEGLAARGRDAFLAAKYKGWLQEFRLVDVVEMKFPMLDNTWPEDARMKRIGQYMYVDLCEMIRGAGWPLLLSLGMSAEEVEELVLQFRKDSLDPRYKVFYNMHIVYGRKLLEKELKVE